MARLLLIMLILYLLYNLVVKFIIPIYRTTRQIKGKMREMQQQQQEFFNQQQQRDTIRPKSQQENQVDKGDYIDYEEVK